MSARAGQSDIMALPRIRPQTGDLDGMLKRRTFRILVPVDRTAFILDKGTSGGFEAELGEEFETWINKKYGNKKLKIHVGFVPTSRNALLSALNDGKGDIAAGLLTVTPERQAIVDFAPPWATGVKEVLVTGPAAGEVNSIDDLGGKSVSVRPSSSYHSHLVEMNAARKVAGKPEIEIMPADEGLGDEDLMEMAGTGMLPWAIVDRFKANAWAAILPNLKVRDGIVIHEGGEIAWAIRKNSPLLQKDLAEFVSTHKIGTEFGNDLKGRYFGTGKTIRNALAAAEKDKLGQLLPSFHESGSTFSIDPLLLAAQGYQESSFDQKMRNASGAVGVMQIKPSTAREKQIAINDVVSSTSNNIRAGAKYLRFLADTYIHDPEISARNRVLMALAAYNAGPGNLKRFREFALKHGFKSNVWFGNVENGAAAIVGQETVQYIGNIYKYDIAYSGLIPAKEASATAGTK
ncbi:membrane-bound lytic murein transglycosylase MltF [Bradyrhizobium sp. F1.4.3]|uniref:transglycosylase SLT domain-containing protein n=1 Tax=Bradyrhizobium sp. F1.4.3 TaxID=3156356 RepID=UPI0033926FEC